jgi:UDP-N-acetylglucosamine diphosphorylase/glucosamine-1-phosphate N-acetyltransferase
MTDIHLLEPDNSPEWSPFAQCRPICELRAGAWLIRERWEAAVDGEAVAVYSTKPMHAFVEEGVPTVSERQAVAGPAFVARSDFAPAGVKTTLPKSPARFVNEATTVGWWVPRGATWEGEHADWVEVEIEGMLLNGSFDIITAQEHFLAPDALDFAHETGDPLPQGSVVIGDPADVVILGAAVEPGTVFDVRGGVVVIEQHCHVRSGTRFEGPVYVGPGTEILGGSISQSSIGPRCKVRGEVTHTTFVGYANKAHDGFVGHSVVGRWVNLGAGTTTSNLKNTYGPIRLKVGDVSLETGRQFLGALFGDHCKTGIGTMLSTGAVVGVGANVFDFPSAPKYVPPLKVAARVMPRRQVEMTEAVQEMLGTIYDSNTNG